MKFLRLEEPLLSVLFEDEDIIAVDKPYGFNTHTNDSKIEHSEFIQDGLIEMLEKQRGQRLHIIHRLDQTTTGVIIFGKSAESAKKYAEFFFNREVKKTYWFITASKSAKAEFLIEDAILHKGKELEAKTQLNLLKKFKAFELWQAKPFTGRNHQIRIHARAAGISILGDPKYEGREFAFLCLHNHKIEFPNKIIVTSKPPAYFEEMSFLEDQTLSKILFEADRRFRLYSFSVPKDQCFRLVHGKSTASETGFSVDQFGEHLVLNWPKEFLHDQDAKRFTSFSKWLNKPLMVRMQKAKKFDAEQSWIAKEKNTNYELKNEVGHTVGLVLNQRLHRHWVQKNSKEKAVLSLFAQTCGYALAAALGGAREVTAIDSSKKDLLWGKRNFQQNQLDPEKFKFLCRDSAPFLKQALSKNVKYDLIICDAPAFLRGEKTVFKIESDLEVLLTSALQCLAPGGLLLFATTFEGFFVADLKSAFLRAQKSLKISRLEIDCIQPAFDFELPYEKPLLKSFLIQPLS
jgi:23S rRNA G2069 N7-methylase RlmK/C1962 C5-methylase RlmI